MDSRAAEILRVLSDRFEELNDIPSARIARGWANGFPPVAEAGSPLFSGGTQYFVETVTTNFDIDSAGLFPNRAYVTLVENTSDIGEE